ncbi:MAG: YIP1 family protein [Nanoarchaeota archaeon]|nr:YIP1 family protein [Nanoarchaeota archaeon]
MHPYLEKYKLLFLNSNGFFKNVQKESEYWDVLKFYVIFTIVSQVISILLNLPTLMKESLFISAMIFSLVGSVVFAFAVPFVSSGIVHLGVLVFKGKKGYFNTFKPITYAMTIGAAYNILSSLINGVYGWFNPLSIESLTSGLAQLEQNVAIVIVSGIIGIVSLIHILRTEILGIGFYQGLTKAKALLSVVLVPLVLFIIIGIIFGFSMAFSSSMFSAL